MTPVTKNALYKPSGNIRPAKEVVALMLKLPLAERYDIYIQGMYRIHPPNLMLRAGIVPLGGDAIEFLKDKLISKTVTRWEKIFIMDLLVEMSDSGCYDVKSDSSLMRAIIETQNQLSMKSGNNPDVAEIIAIESISFNNFGRFRQTYELSYNIKCHK